MTGASFLFFFPPISFIIFALLFSLPPITQIRGRIASSFPPLPTTVRSLHFYREKNPALSSLVDSHRIVLTHARRSQQLILFFTLVNNFKISPRRDSNSRINTSSSIRGLPLLIVHRGDRFLTQGIKGTLTRIKNKTTTS